MDNRQLVDKIEFYITNVCNLTCDDCNRYNNYKFSGWQNWNDYKDDYASWSKKIKFNQITILGGEPLLNPTICEWIEGINNLWDNRIQILTNGTRLNQVKGLYDLLVNDRNWIGVSLHNASEFEGFEKEVYKFLKGKVSRVVNQRNTYAPFSYTYVDSNSAKIYVYCQDTFVNTPLIRNGENQFNLHNSDPEQAHSVCGFAKYKNYHMIKGKFYKCGPSVLLSEFDQQHTINLSDQDRTLLNAYQPLSAHEYDTRGTEFFSNLDQPIPQCKFCPTEFTSKQIFPISKEFSL